MIAFVLLLILPAALGQFTNNVCFNGLTKCFQDVEKERGTGSCRISRYLTKCLSDVTAVCYPSVIELVNGYGAIVEEAACKPNSHILEDYVQLGQCILQQGRQFGECKLEGELDTLAELCSSTIDSFECVQQQIEKVCPQNAAKIYSRFAKISNDAAHTCQRSNYSKAYVLSPCEKQFLMCDRHIFGYKYYTCRGVESTLRCYGNVLKQCDPNADFYAPIMADYLDQFNDICNPKSDFRQNLNKSYACILTKLTSIVPCNEIYRENMQQAVTDQTKHKDLLMTILRLNLQHYNCIARRMGSACGPEAAAVVRYLLKPVEEFNQKTCLQISGERCSGSAGLQCSFVICILCILFVFLSRRSR